MRIPTALLLSTLMAGTSQLAFGVAPLSTSTLAEYCGKTTDSALDERSHCVSYIRGYLDGAVTTDERVLENVSSLYEQERQKESYAERAIRTRAPGVRLSYESKEALLKQYGATVYADYCLGEPVPIRDVVSHVVDSLNKPETLKQHQYARDLIYSVLIKRYPCKT